MKLSAVRVRNFRSLQDTGIDNIDDFNVLIGKNNSGKSNFLSAINAFFQILSNESLVSSRPIIGNSADFSKSHPNVPISICARFLPSEHEISQLLTAMREERPQIRTALDALPHELSLSIELRILPPPSGYSFVKVVALADLSNDQKSWTLLKIGRESSYALYRNYQEDQAARRYQQSITRAISRIDEDDWRRLREARASENFMYRSLFDPGFAEPVPADVIASVRRMIESSQSFAEFQAALTDRLGALEEERRVISEKRLQPPVQTFAGTEDQIPQYIKALISSIVSLKVLFL